MATLEDKLLGEKLDYYCSSSDDEDDQGGVKLIKDEEIGDKPLDMGRWAGETSNTGPKGVLKDWQRYKQLETEKRAENEAERLALIKKLSLSCLTKDEEDKLKAKELEAAEEEDGEMDQIMMEYISQRMAEMVSAAQRDDRPRFGRLLILKNQEDFLNAIDNEHKNTTVFIHIYGAGSPECDALNACFNTLAEEYPFYKFCVISTQTAGMTACFEKYGVPALVVYRGGNLVGNFVKLSNEFDEDFESADVEGFLVDHGLLPDPSTVPKVVRDMKRGSQDDEDDDD